MIEIFKTNVQNKAEAKRVAVFLKEIFPEAEINFDLSDCDRILRVKGINESGPPAIVADVRRLGFTCEVLN